MHASTFDYLQPTETQREHMTDMRSAFHELSIKVGQLVPPGTDRDHVIRLVRDAAMWANVAITRHADGQPRKDLGAEA